MWEALMSMDLRPLFLIGWAVSFVYLANLHLAIWQEREYRLDRFRAFLHTTEGKRYLWNILVWVKLSIFCAIPALYVLSIFDRWILWLVGLVYLLQVGVYATVVTKKWMPRPVYTPKVIAVLLAELVIEGMLLSLVPHVEIFFYVEFLRPILLALLLTALLPGKLLLQHWTIAQAQKRLAAMDHVIVIGIAGSFGKTATQDFLKVLLEKRFRVYTTPTHASTTYAVARSILKDCTPDKKIEVIIVEMGGYRSGEIRKLCALVQPRFGIMTGINKSRCALFGSTDALYASQFELLQSLPKETGFAVLNGDVHYPSSLLMEVAVPKKVYSFDCEYADAFVERIVATHKGSDVVANVDDTSVAFHLPIPGTHNVMNMMGCLLVAKKLGLRPREIEEAMSTMQTPRGRISLHRSPKGAVILDNTYNTNPAGVHKALEVLDMMEGRRKVLITMGVPEMGIERDQVHYRLGLHIGKVVDECVLFNEDIIEPMTDGIKESGGYRTRVRICKNYQQLREFITKGIFEDDVVLLEYALPGNLRTLLEEDL